MASLYLILGPMRSAGISLYALLCFYPEIALHITRPIRWDSDHVVLFDDETKEMAKEIVRCDGLDRVYGPCGLRGYPYSRRLSRCS